MAGMPGSGGVAHRTPVDLPTTRAVGAMLLAPALVGAIAGAATLPVALALVALSALALAVGATRLA